MSVFVNSALMKKVIRSNAIKSSPALHWMSGLAQKNSWSIKRVDVDAACHSTDCAHRAVLHLQSGAIVEAPASKGGELCTLLNMLQAKLPDVGLQHFSKSSLISEAEMTQRLDEMFVKMAISLSKPKKKKRTGLAQSKKSSTKEKEPRVVRKRKK